MRRIERFDKYMEIKHLNDNKVTVQSGLSVGTLCKSRKENRDLSINTIEKILNFYTDLSRDWLLTGRGEMIKSGDIIQDSPTAIAENHSTTVTGYKNTVNSDPTIAKLIDELAAQRRLTESAQEALLTALKQNTMLINKLK